MTEINPKFLNRQIEKADENKPTQRVEQKPAIKDFGHTAKDFPSDPDAQAYEYLKSEDGQKLISRFGDVFQKIEKK